MNVRKREQPLKRMAWLEALFNGLPDAILVIDRDGRLVYCNQAAINLLGQPPDSIAPEAWAETYGFFRADGHTLYSADALPVVRALNGESVEDEELLLRPANGTASVWVHMTAKSLSETDEGIEGVMVMLRDISKRKEMEAFRETAARQAESLHLFSRELAEIGPYLSSIVKTLAEYCSRNIGDACIITISQNGRLQNLAADHPQPEPRALLRQVALQREPVESDFIRRVMEAGQPVVFASLSSSAKKQLVPASYQPFIEAVGVQSFMLVPLKGREGVVGVISLSRDEGQSPYTSLDEAYAVDIAYRASLAIENSSLYESLRTEKEERISAKKAQKESEERLRAIFESTALGIKVLSLEGKIIQINPALQNMLGYSSTELFGRHFTELIHPADVGRGHITFDAIQHGLRDLRFEHRLIHKNKSIVWVNTTLTGIKASPDDVSPTFAVGMVDNITERKKIEFELMEVRGRFLQGIEKERLRLAQDLHDGPMQDLHSATYLLASLPPLDALAHERLESVNEVIQEVISDLRAMAQELRPPAIIDFGLEKAIHSHIEDLRDKYPEMKFQISLDEEDLTEEIRLAFFRIYQTSVANVIRHAAATEVSVRLAVDAEEVSLEIIDNGKGFQVPPRWIMLMRKGHFGLAGAAERVEALGGSFEVISAPGQGTRILVRLALPTERTDEIINGNSEVSRGH